MLVGPCDPGAATVTTTANPPAPAAVAVEWLTSHAPVPYETAVRFMERRVDAILTGRATEAVWLLEHPPLYTAGTSADDDELLDAARFPVFRTGRGGRYTYHGPGQRVVYVMLDLRRRGADVRGFVCALEGWIIAALARCGVAARRAPGRIGVWVDLPAAGDSVAPREAKIAAVGVRVRRWVSWHGIAINVAPDLTHFSGIVPCGISDYPVTSFAALGRPDTLADVDRALRDTFVAAFAG